MRRKQLCWGLVFVLLFLFIGCGKEQNSVDTNSGVEDSNKDTIVQQPNTDDVVNGEDNQNNQNNQNTDNSSNSDDTSNSGENKEESEKDFLSYNEVLWFEEIYFNDRNSLIVNKFLHTTFEDPTQIDYWEIFKHGTLDRNRNPVSSEEYALIKQYYPDTDFFVEARRITAEDIQSIVKKYTNLNVEETQKIGLDERFYYLEEFDAYYVFREDTYGREFEFTSGWRNEDGTITLQYYNDPMDKLYDVTLRAYDNGFFFVSNLEAQKEFKTEKVEIDIFHYELEYVKTIDADDEYLLAFRNGTQEAYEGVITYYNYETGEAKFDIYERVESPDHPLGWFYAQVDEIRLQMFKNCEIWFIHGKQFGKIKMNQLESLVEGGFMETHMFDLYISDGEIQCMIELYLP